MDAIQRLPALPLIVNDPYFSIWMPGDTFTDAAPVHWSGAQKNMMGLTTIDGKRYCFLGKTSRAGMRTKALRVYPTSTESVMEAEGVELTLTFWSPALPDDLDALSTPITFVEMQLRSLDEKPHHVGIRFVAGSGLCYDGQDYRATRSARFAVDGLNMALRGQTQQKVLGHSGDHITMDWGYLYMASRERVSDRDGLTCHVDAQLAPDTPYHTFLMLGYDDVASVNYFGAHCRAWYQRGGQTLQQALCAFDARHDALLAACKALDDQVLTEAREIGGEDYALIAAAAWRHTFWAHKLIATPTGELAMLSKENDSNGCIGTADVSYPSIPLFLKYCPELVNALCRPVMEFAAMPVWEYDFAPHDVGRYPYATGQVYGAPWLANGLTPPPYYLYAPGMKIYDPKMQMPVEECGNMLIMLEAAMAYGASETLLGAYGPMLEKWVRYLDLYGEDPGEQLCTDDFAGHLAHNVNLSAKAIVGIACYARMMQRVGQAEKAQHWQRRARELADSWLRRTQGEEGTPLTFDGQGWSMKYNTVWDLVLGLGLFPEDFYAREGKSYLKRMNRYGLPLDSRAAYTKSDWMVWCACLARDKEVFCRIIAPLARYLKETPSRVPFSDWYDTQTGAYVFFIARSVQGGVYMPMLLGQKETDRAPAEE